jgi:hypothetical protein
VRPGLVLALRCTLAVTVTTVAVQLWGMALQDDVPLPAPIFSLPATDAAVAAATPRPRVHRIRPAVVVSAGLVAAAQQRPRPAQPPNGNEDAVPATPPAASHEGNNGTPPTESPPTPKSPDLTAPPRPRSPRPAPEPPSSSPETVPLQPPPMPVEPPELHVAPLAPRTDHAGPGARSQGKPPDVEAEGGRDGHSP